MNDVSKWLKLLCNNSKKYIIIVSRKYIWDYFKLWEEAKVLKTLKVFKFMGIEA